MIKPAGSLAVRKTQKQTSATYAASGKQPLLDVLLGVAVH
jgi:hypothetical protein